MSNLNEIQPIDEHVRSLLEEAKERYHLDINVGQLTRGQRLEAAVAMRDQEKGIYSLEIMVGRKINSSDTVVAFLLFAQAVSPQDPRTFYDAFAHQYSLNEK